MEVGNGCDMLLGDTGTTRQVNWTTIGEPGTFTFNKLTVTAGGEVTVPVKLTGKQSKLKMKVCNKPSYGLSVIILNANIKIKVKSLFSGFAPKMASGSSAGVPTYQT